MDDAKSVYRFPAQIDFTDQSLYDKLCKYESLNAPVKKDIYEPAIAAAESKF